jgi:hypothetical protein
VPNSELTLKLVKRGTQFKRRLSLSRLLVVAPGLVALGLGAYQLSLPHSFWGVHGADDGVYLAPALRLVHGAVPYRDYAFVHPPGIALLMAPLGIFGDTRDAMAAARVVTALVAGLNASLAAFAVRSLGRVAMLVAGLTLAVFPLATSADHTLTLEPYLVLFCLLGTVVMFSGGELASARRVLAAGALFGFAGALKVWAVFPVIVALCLCMLVRRPAVRPFLSGLLVGFGLPSLPFFLLAPRTFVHDVVVAQLARSGTGEGYHALGERLVLLLGLSTHANVEPRTHLAWAVALVLFGLVAEVYVTAARRSPLDWFLLGSTALAVLAALFLVKDFYAYYAYFTAAFGGMLLGVSFGRLADGVRSVIKAAPAVLTALVIAGAALVVPSRTGYARSFLGGAYDPQATIAEQIPAGACVVFDEAGNLIDSNRFFASRPGCPPLVDAFALWLTDNRGTPPPARPRSEAFVAKWRSWLERADYAVLAIPTSNYVPWTDDLRSWFNDHYRLVASQQNPNAPLGVYVYEHVAHSRST